MLPLPVCEDILPHSLGFLDEVVSALVPAALRHSLVDLLRVGLSGLCPGPIAQTDWAQQSDPDLAGRSSIGLTYLFAQVNCFRVPSAKNNAAVVLWFSRKRGERRSVWGSLSFCYPENTGRGRCLHDSDEGILGESRAARGDALGGFKLWRALTK